MNSTDVTAEYSCDLVPNGRPTILATARHAFAGNVVQRFVAQSTGIQKSFLPNAVNWRLCNRLSAESLYSMRSLLVAMHIGGIAARNPLFAP